MATARGLAEAWLIGEIEKMRRTARKRELTVADLRRQLQNYNQPVLDRPQAHASGADAGCAEGLE